MLLLFQRAGSILLSTKKYTQLTMLQFYSYIIAVRNRVFSLFHSAEKLFHQYLVDAYTKMEANNLNYIRENQTQIRAEKYKVKPL